MISGDITGKLSSSRPTLFIINHTSRIDWLFCSSLFIRLSSLHKQKTVTKSEFTNGPFFGWAYAMCMHIFVRQGWEKDKQTFRDTIGYYFKRSYPMQLAIFPEGTALTDANRKKHREFATKNGLEVYECVMHPRTKGFIKCVNILKEKTEFDICNVTLAYTGKICHLDQRTLEGI